MARDLYEHDFAREFESGSWYESFGNGQGSGLTRNYDAFFVYLKVEFSAPQQPSIADSLLSSCSSRYYTGEPRFFVVFDTL
jgi:hypothetical protein